MMVQIQSKNSTKIKEADRDPDGKGNGRKTA